MEGTKELITTDAIRSKVYILRGQQVMLDQDLAEIYGYQVKNLNQQVKRNLTRFPEDFMFQLTKEEVELVKSQFVTSRNINYFEGQEGGRRKLPYAFTEQVELRQYLQRVADNTDFTAWYFGHFHEDTEVEEMFYCLYDGIVVL